MRRRGRMFGPRSDLRRGSSGGFALPILIPTVVGRGVSPSRMRRRGRMFGPRSVHGRGSSGGFALPILIPTVVGRGVSPSRMRRRGRMFGPRSVHGRGSSRGFALPILIPTVVGRGISPSRMKKRRRIRRIRPTNLRNNDTLGANPRASDHSLRLSPLLVFCMHASAEKEIATRGSRVGTRGLSVLHHNQYSSTRHCNSDSQHSRQWLTRQYSYV